MEFSVHFKPEKKQLIQALLFISFGKNKALNKSRLLILGSGILLLFLGLKGLSTPENERKVFFLTMGLVFIVYGFFFLKSARYRLMEKKVDKFHFGQFVDNISITISKDLIKEKTAIQYTEYKPAGIANVYELKDQFVFLTKQGSILNIPSKKVDSLEAFRDNVKEWYPYENFHHWKW